MLALMNIGNTRSQLAEFSGGFIRNIRYVQTEKLSPAMLPENMPVAASTVVPESKKLFSGKNIFWLNSKIACGVDLSRVNAAELGNDRLANIIQLATAAPLPALCIDCGTAITFELVDEHKVFLGGAIAPGRMIQRKALHQNTAQLPALTVTQDKLLALPGKNTEDSMRLGIDNGLIGAVKEIVSTLTAGKNGSVTLIAIGGDAKFLINNIPGIEYGGEDFTLKGILKAWEINHK